MQGKSEQLRDVLRRTDVIYSIVFMVLYAVWIVWPIYGCLPFFGFAMMLVFKYTKTRNGLRRLTMAARNQFPDRLPEKKWHLLLRYAVAIYVPAAAASLAKTFRWCEFGGYGCLAVLAIQQRWVDVLACFSACMLALQMQRMLQPETYFMKLAVRKPDEYGPMAEDIRELQKWVLSDAAP
jgi:hypothetical protein